MLYAIVLVIILIIDQAAKYWTSVKLALGATSPFIPGFIKLTNVHNTGAAFGFLQNVEAARWIFVVLTIIVAVGAVILLRRNIIKGKLGRWMLVLIIAGGLGNCIDRIINGYVVDMFQFQFMNFAIFNVSDIFITVCGVIFCFYLIFHKEPEEEQQAPAPVRTPSRTMPKPAERPVRADYISQLKKPVVEGRRNIEAELAAKAAEAQAARNPEGIVTDWNAPDFGFEEMAPDTKAEAEPEPKAVAPDAAEPSPAAEPSVTNFDELFKSPAKPAKNDNSDFNLEDIIAEFKDK